MFHLSPEHLDTLAFVANLQVWTKAAYHAPVEMQRHVWHRENELDKEKHGWVDKSFDEWLATLTQQIDAIHCDSPIFMLAADLVPTPMAVHDVSPRIIVWQDHMVFYGGESCAYWRAPSRMYYLGALADGPTFAGGLYWLSTQEAKRHTLTAGQRLGLSRARVRRHRDYYYVAAITRQPQPISEPRGGHHSSPVAHDRRAHQALLSRVDVPRDEIMDLVQRGYNVERTEVTPVEIIERMKLRGKEAVPNTLCAWRWIDRPQMKVNPEGPQSRRVTVVTLPQGQTPEA